MAAGSRQDNQQQAPDSVKAPADSHSTEAENLEAAIQSALDCPCVKDLREGPCGEFFKAAFTCFHRSKDVIKGAECFQQNVAFAECLAAHPEVADSMGKSSDSPPVQVPELPVEQFRTNIAPSPS